MLLHAVTLLRRVGGLCSTWSQGSLHFLVRMLGPNVDGWLLEAQEPRLLGSFFAPFVSKCMCIYFAAFAWWDPRWMGIIQARK